MIAKRAHHRGAEGRPRHGAVVDRETRRRRAAKSGLTLKAALWSASEPKRALGPRGVALSKRPVPLRTAAPISSVFSGKRLDFRTIRPSKIVATNSETVGFQDHSLRQHTPQRIDRACHCLRGVLPPPKPPTIRPTICSRLAERSYVRWVLVLPLRNFQRGSELSRIGHLPETPKCTRPIYFWLAPPNAKLWPRSLANLTAGLLGCEWRRDGIVARNLR